MSTHLATSNPHIPSPSTLPTKLLKTLSNTTKSDKYVRLVSSMTKYVRCMDPARKTQYAGFYRQLLVLRQVIRWNGIYQAVK